jgi:hypothetical protein
MMLVEKPSPCDTKGDYSVSLQSTVILQQPPNLRAMRFVFLEVKVLGVGCEALAAKFPSSSAIWHNGIKPIRAYRCLHKRRASNVLCQPSVVPVYAVASFVLRIQFFQLRKNPKG